MSRDQERAPEDALRNHPLRDTQEFESDIRGREAGTADPAASLPPEDEARYRALYEASPNRLAGRSYEDVRPFYHLGHIARGHPDYRQRTFDEIEDDLQKGWTPDLRARYGDWSSVRPFAREAFSARQRDKQ
jgi:hypothetical protein